MKIMPVSSNDTTFKKKWLGNIVEKFAATVPTEAGSKRKSIPIEYHDALVKLTAWRVFAFTLALSGVGGYKISDVMSDKEAEDFSNAVQIADIDTTAPVEIKDMTNDGNTDLILTKKDGSKVVLDLKNLDVLTESYGLKAID